MNFPDAEDNMDPYMLELEYIGDDELYTLSVNFIQNVVTPSLTSKDLEQIKIIEQKLLEKKKLLAEAGDEEEVEEVEGEGEEEAEADEEEEEEEVEGEVEGEVEEGEGEEGEEEVEEEEDGEGAEDGEENARAQITDPQIKQDRKARGEIENRKVKFVGLAEFNLTQSMNYEKRAKAMLDACKKKFPKARPATGEEFTMKKIIGPYKPDKISQFGKHVTCTCPGNLGDIIAKEDEGFIPKSKGSMREFGLAVVSPSSLLSDSEFTSSLREGVLVVICVEDI